MIEVTRKKRIGAMWVIECPLCHRWLAGAAERSWLPEIEICYCDEHQKNKENGK